MGSRILSHQMYHEICVMNNHAADCMVSSDFTSAASSLLRALQTLKRRIAIPLGNEEVVQQERLHSVTCQFQQSMSPVLENLEFCPHFFLKPMFGEGSIAQSHAPLPNSSLHETIINLSCMIMYNLSLCRQTQGLDLIQRKDGEMIMNEHGRACLAQAVELISRTLQLRPNVNSFFQLVLLNNMASLYLLLGHFQQSEKVYSRLLEEIMVFKSCSCYSQDKSLGSPDLEHYLRSFLQNIYMRSSLPTDVAPAA